MATAAADFMKLVNATAKTGAVRADARKPFRFFLCGDPALVSELRALLLRAPDSGEIMLDAAATLETIDAGRLPIVSGADARAIIFLGRRATRAVRASICSLR